MNKEQQKPFGEAALARQEADKMDIVAYRLLYLDHSGEWVMIGRPWVDGRPDPELLKELVEPNSRWRIEYAYAAPPVQAVDLVQFRRPLKVARTSMEWARNDDAVAECDRLLALIDQQAGKGNDRAK